MSKLSLLVLATAAALGLTACASRVQSPEETALKSFPAPEAGKAGVYLYRDTYFGAIYGRDMFVNGACIGRSGAMSFYYIQLPGNQDYVFSTESEFSPNSLKLHLKSGQNYYLEQDIKVGLLVPGAEFQLAEDEAEAQETIRESTLLNAKCREMTYFGYFEEFPEMMDAPNVRFGRTPPNMVAVSVPTFGEPDNQSTDQLAADNSARTLEANPADGATQDSAAADSSLEAKFPASKKEILADQI